MLSFLLKRLLLVPLTVWLVGSVVFIVSHFVPGTYADRLYDVQEISPAGSNYTSTNQHFYPGQPMQTPPLPLFYFALGTRAQPGAAVKTTQEISVAALFNLLSPDLHWHGTQNQYHVWLHDLATGSLGRSYRDGRPVRQLLAEAIGNTLFLLLASLALIFLLGTWFSRFLIGRSGAGQPGIWLGFLYILDSIPLFITALLLLTFLASSGYLGLFPVFGLGLGNNTGENWLLSLLNQLHHLALPLICLVLAGLPYVTTQLYQAMQSLKNSDFITTARAKGLPEKRVVHRHLFRNALLPLITLFTGYLPVLIGGALVIEIIFAIPGTGRLLADSIAARDYPVVMGLILALAALKAISHVLADFLYFTADPRTRPTAS